MGGCLIRSLLSRLLLLTCLLASTVPVALATPLFETSPEETLRAVQGAAPKPRDLASLVAELSGTPASRVVNSDTPDYRTGHLERFWIGRQRPPEHFQVDAELRLVGRHAYWYVQRGHSVSDAALRRSAEVFDAHVYPEVRRLVGAEPFPGIDNDPRITILSASLPDVAGYVSSVDSYPRSIHPHSNEREMIYLNLVALEVGSAAYLATLAHEFTHLVHWNVNPSEDTWIKEGLAEIISSLLFPERAMPSSAFLANPDLQLNAWSDGVSDPTPVGAHYQAAAWFLRYFVDRLGEEVLDPFLAQDTFGVASMDRFLAAHGRSFAELVSEWAVANVVGSHPGPDSGVFPYRSVAPPPRNQRPAVGEVRDTVGQFGTDYYAVDPQAPVTFEGAVTVPLIAARPSEGQMMWYAGRADSSVATLTRAFDLSSVDAATLSYAIWCDLEPDYDFAYVGASRDGGQTWQLLEAPSMSRTNPSGSNLGVGYTGRCGGGAQPRWIDESIDLAPFAGGTVWVRFSYVTDDAYVREGVALDNIRVDAVAYADGAEASLGGWAARGWARVGAELPQQWVVQIVEFQAESVAVSQLPLDAEGRATWRSEGRSVDRAILAVTAATPVTLQRASYRLSFTRQSAE